MTFPGSNATNPLGGLPPLDLLPDHIDVFTLYRRVFCGINCDMDGNTGATGSNQSANWWYHGFVTIQGHGAPPMLMLETHNLVSCRLREKKEDEEKLVIDWVMLVEFDDVYSGGPSKSIHNPLTGLTGQSNSELSLLIERPGMPSYHGQIVAGLLRNDHNRVCLLQTQPQRTASPDGSATSTQLTLMLTADRSAVLGKTTATTAQPRRPGRGGALPGRGVFWGFQHGPLNTLFGFDEGVCGEFRTQGRLVRGGADEAVVPGLWKRYRADFPGFFDGQGALSPDWDGLFSGRLKGDGLNRKVLRIDDGDGTGGPVDAGVK
ncbi:uncharacterized protein PG986_009916 [Apiospora aurea]|uniref:Uncharacterized protein n=1 Tax=Apiospora aurea TaxID=335848 RepID=A0ABR1Q9A0_9PEZI